jgi:hypothetical protein
MVLKYVNRKKSCTSCQAPISIYNDPEIYGRAFLDRFDGHDLHGGTHVVAGKEDAAEYGLEAIVGHRSTSNKLVAEFLFAGDLHRLITHD